MYLISILAFVLVVFFISYTAPVYPGAFIDLPTILLILCISVPILLSTGLGKDFSNAFRIALNPGKECTKDSLKKALEAVRLVIRTLLCSGGAIFLLNGILTLHRLDDPAKLGPTMSLSFLSLLYALAITLFLLPIQSILKTKLMEDKDN